MNQNQERKRNDRLGSRLLKRGLVEAGEIDRATETAHERGLALEDAFVELGLLTEDQAVALAAEELCMPHVFPYANAIDRDLVAQFPPHLLRRHGAVPLAREGTDVILAVAKVIDSDARRELEEACGAPVILSLASRRRVERALSELLGSAPNSEAGAKDPSAVTFLYGHLAAALAAGATEIRFEPVVGAMSVRYRLGDRLEERSSEAPALLHPLISRLRALLEEGGSRGSNGVVGVMRTRIGEHDVTLETTVLPTRCGDSVLVRIDRRDRKPAAMEQFDLDDAALPAIRNAAALRSGLLLVSSSDALAARRFSYAFLRAVEPSTRSVVTIESAALEDEQRFRQVETRGAPVAQALPAVLAYQPDMVYLEGPLHRMEDVAAALAVAGSRAVVVSADDESAADALTSWVASGAAPWLLARRLGALVTIAGRRATFMDPPRELREAIENGSRPWQIRALFRDMGVL